MESLQNFLREGSKGDLLPWPCQCGAMERFGLTCAEVEDAALTAGLLPMRYQRNRQMLSTRDQLRLFRSTVAVVGCGGLGGYLLEELARLGVGALIAVDPDIFEEHNLNRQLLSTPEQLGRPKVEAAAERISAVNPAVILKPVRALIDRESGTELLAGADVVADAVDNVSARLALGEVCTRLRVPLVHGAIAGWYGHVATVLPGDTTLERIYANWQGGKGIEQELGNPSFTPAVAASLEAAEVCKVLLGRGRLLRHRKLVIDLLEMEITEVSLE